MHVFGLLIDSGISFVSDKNVDAIRHNTAYSCSLERFQALHVLA